jgi:beta-glucosidase
MQLLPTLFLTSGLSRLNATVLLVLGVSFLVSSAVAAQSSTKAEKRDGAYYDHFLRINKRIGKSNGDVDLIFVGDSITMGWDGPGRAIWKYYYGDRKALNLGVNGDRTEHVLWRLQNGNLEGIQPKVAILMIGVNNSWGDSAADIVAGIKAVVAVLRSKLPETKVLLLDILPVGKSFNSKRGELLQVNQTVQNLHDGVNIIYLPVGNFFLDKNGSISKSIMPDYLHPSELGYDIWARNMETTLAFLLGDEPKSPKVTAVPVRTENR